MNTDDTKSQSRLRRFWQSRYRNWVFAGMVATGAALLTASLESVKTRQAAALIFAQPKLDALPVVPANMRWGFALDEFHLFEDELRYGNVLGEMLMKQGIAYPVVAKLVENCKGVFNIASMRVGKKLSFLSRQQGAAPTFMVYEPSPYEYAVFQLEEPYKVEIVKRDVVTQLKASSGVLETNFWQALTDNGLSDELADGMIDVLAASVDFYHQKVGDRFKVVYEQHYVEGEPVGTGKILAAEYEREGKHYYAVNYQQEGEKSDYFDYEGHPARKAFLKAPVKFSRISSRYSLNRLHPILGYNRPHFGTDYAAPYGTPILAVADGTVLEAGRRGGNGNFVKIRHDGAIETQYLHMSSFARGVRAGTRVVQGQTIGYVGSTGLATGPHVCFRFWKNGRQGDFLRQNLPQPKPISGAVFQQFTVVRDSMIRMLDAVSYRTRDEIFRDNAGVQKSEFLNP